MSPVPVPNKRFETDSLRRRFAPPPLAVQAIRYVSLNYNTNSMNIQNAKVVQLLISESDFEKGGA